MVRRALLGLVGVLALGCGSASSVGSSLPQARVPGGELAAPPLDADAALARADALLAAEGGDPARDLEIGRALHLAGLPETARFYLSSAAGAEAPDLALAALAWWCAAPSAFLPAVRARLEEAEVDRVLATQPVEIADCVRELLVRGAVDEEPSRARAWAARATETTGAGRRARLEALRVAVAEAAPDGRLALVRAWASGRGPDDVEARIALALAWESHPEGLVSPAGPSLHHAILLAHRIPTCDWERMDTTPLGRAISELAARYGEGEDVLALSLEIASQVCDESRPAPTVSGSLDLAGLLVPRLRASSGRACHAEWERSRLELTSLVVDARAASDEARRRAEADPEWPLRALSDTTRAEPDDRRLLALATRPPRVHAVAAALGPDVDPPSRLELVLRVLGASADPLDTAAARSRELDREQRRAAAAHGVTRTQSESLTAQARGELAASVRGRVLGVLERLVSIAERELEEVSRIEEATRTLDPVQFECASPRIVDDSAPRP
ncbi:MAG: hypothetical protein K1X94_05005 [Sandaracinaceae bacterium]|nr:hypothetical protein [Sandaracinaceae bacterium]